MFYFFSIFSETESTRGAWGPQPTLEHDEHGRTVPHEPVPSNSAVRDKGGRHRHWGDLLKPRCPVCSQMAHIHKAMLAKTDFPLHPCRRGRETGRPRRRCAQHAPAAVLVPGVSPRKRTHLPRLQYECSLQLTCCGPNLDTTRTATNVGSEVRVPIRQEGD